jgi:hypothetical protein
LLLLRRDWCCGLLEKVGNTNNWYSGTNDEGTRMQELMARAVAARSYASFAIHNGDEESTPGLFNDSIHRLVSTHLLDVESNTLRRLDAVICT